MEYLNQIERIIESGHRVIAMESYGVERVCELFLQYSRFSSSPYYIAKPEHAMHRFGASHIHIPKTQSSHGLINHIEATQHFGIYILCNYMEVLEDNKLVEKLINIATGDTHKIVIMISEHLSLPAQLKPYAAVSKHKVKKRA